MGILCTQLDVAVKSVEKLEGNLRLGTGMFNPVVRRPNERGEG